MFANKGLSNSLAKLIKWDIGGGQRMTAAEKINLNKRRQADMLEEEYRKGSMYLDPITGNRIAVKKKGRLTHIVNKAATIQGKV